MNKENLKYELPDFINGKNHSEKIKEEIEVLLKTDSEFRKYYEELSSAAAFLHNTELDAPSDAYFTNLSARINERISENVTAKKSTGLKDILKYLIPVIPVVIIIVFVFFNSGNNSSQRAGVANIIEIPVNISDNSGEEKILVEKSTDEPVVVNDSKERSGTFPSRKRNTFTGNRYTADETRIQQLGEQRERDLLENEPADDGLSLTDYDLILDSDDNYSVEDEFEDLSPEKQQEVLTNLSRADI